MTTRTEAAPLVDEGRLPGFDGATGWLNTEPLSPADLRGKVVLVDFWTYTCINWLRTLPYLRAWADKYARDGLVLIGVHTPEFGIEQDLGNIRQAMEAMRIEYPVAVDSDYAIWRAFDNQYWPAIYMADRQGRLRYHHFGEGRYEETERAIQQLLGVGDGLVSLEPSGVEVAADWATLRSPETYVGYLRAEGFASEGGLVPDERVVYAAPERLDLNEWALAGDWTIEGQPAVLNEPGGRISHHFQARDLNLVLAPSAQGTPVRFRVSIDGRPPGAAHGLDVGEEGGGTVSEARLYQLIRQPGSVTEHTFEIAFADRGARAYVFTFG